MKGLFPDWRAQGVTVCLHEHQGGFAFNLESVAGSSGQVRERRRPDPDDGRGDGLRARARTTARSSAVETSGAAIEVGEQVVVAPGPWAPKLLVDARAARPDRHAHAVGRRRRATGRCGRTGTSRRARSPSTRCSFATADGGAPPVIHLDTDAPLTTDDGRLVTDELWGIYFKRDRHGVQGGASPLTVDGDVELDPYPSTTDVDPDFPDMWCAALSHAMSRFEGCREQLQDGALGRRRARSPPTTSRSSTG